MNSDECLVSVVLTTYKRSHLLMSAVNSVLNGTYRNVELVIVNDCSPDDTDDVVANILDPRVKYLKLTKNVGVLAARNRGFDVCTGDLITILDDDDALVPDALERVATSYFSLPTAQRGILWFDCRDKESGRRSGTIPGDGGVVNFDVYLSGRIRGDFWLVFDRQVLVGERFDERLRAHESLFWLRLHRRHPAYHFPIVLCEKAREHGERLCNLHVRLAQLPQTTLALSEFDRQFGAELRRLAPLEYGEKLAYLGLHQLMTGEFRCGRRSIKTSLRYRFSAKYLFLYIFSFFAGTGPIRKLYVYSESKS